MESTRRVSARYRGEEPLVSGWCPRQDSNLRSRLRRAVLYPLSYGGRTSATLAHGARTTSGVSLTSVIAVCVRPRLAIAG